jgi:hypothetical protein
MLTYINIQEAFKTTITLPYGKLGEVIDWCRKNCTGDFKFEESVSYQHNYIYMFYFEQEQDFFKFIMWKK